MRRTELEKIDTLEDKIKLELSQLEERQTTMEKEVTEFGSVSHVPIRGTEMRSPRAVARGNDGPRPPAACQEVSSSQHWRPFSNSKWDGTARPAQFH